MKGGMKRYVRGLTLAMLFYVVCVPVVIWSMEQMADSPWRYAIAVAPVVPILLGLRVFLGLLDDIDELQRRIQLSGIAFAAGMTGVITFAYGWLEVAGMPPLPMLWVFPLMIGLWGVGLAIANKRYQ